eukprot:scaffold34114_cov41-Tisochrysis_lutea.AAC.2
MRLFDAHCGAYTDRSQAVHQVDGPTHYNLCLYHHQSISIGVLAPCLHRKPWSLTCACDDA